MVRKHQNGAANSKEDNNKQIKSWATIMTSGQEKDVQKKMIAIAQDVISGSTHPIIGIRSLNSLRTELALFDDEVFYTVIALDSDSDTFPLGEFRGKCAPEYLARKDDEMNDFLNDYHSDIIETCQEIIAFLSK